MKQNLIGATIKEVRQLTQDERDALLWDNPWRPGTAIELDNGTTLILSSDDEGNDAGSLFQRVEGKLLLVIPRPPETEK